MDRQLKTEFIGLKEFRANISALWKKAQKKRIRYIVMNHTKPIFEVRPLSEKEASLEQLAADIAEARAQYKKGEYYTEEEIIKQFGLDD